MFNSVTEKQFETLRKRFALVAEANFKGLDERIIRTVKRLAAVPGVVPIWSCSGHPAAEQLARRPERKVATAQRRHVVFAVCGAKDAFFEGFSDWHLNLPYDKFLNYRPTLKATFLNWGFDENGHSVKGQKGTIYPVWDLSFTYALESSEPTQDRNLFVDPASLEKYWQSVIDNMIRQ